MFNFLATSSMVWRLLKLTDSLLLTQITYLLQCFIYIIYVFIYLIYMCVPLLFIYKDISSSAYQCVFIL